MIIRCPECEATGGVRLEWKAFVSQAVHLEEGALTPEPYTSEDVSADDGPEWYVCTDCGYESEDGSEFIETKEE